MAAYVLIAFIWSAYQGYRGVLEHSTVHKGQPWFDSMPGWKRFLFLYLHDFMFRAICTLAGFLALGFAYDLADRTDFANLSGGAATLLIACFLIGIVGVGGQLNYVILLGKVPR